MMLQALRCLSRALLFCFIAITADAAGTLKVSAIPDEAPTELLRKFAPLGKYLEQQLGMKIEFIPATDYAAVVESLATKKIDLAWLGGFTCVQANLRGGAVPIVQRQEDENFTSKFITAAGSGIDKLADLKGKTFAFGSVSSTSGHLMPRYFLMQNNINPDTDFKRIAFSGAHDATVLWIASGKADAGALNASVWDKLVESGKVDAAKVKVLGTTPPYYDYNWTVRLGLDTAVVKKLTDAFLGLDPANAEHKAILDLQRASRYLPTKIENYKAIESAARTAGLIQ
jgi:phosphonate transport system substrate-binding protein